MAGMAEHQFVDLVRLDGRAVQRGPDRLDPQVDRRDLREGALKPAHGRSGALDDYCTVHGVFRRRAG